MLLLAFDTATAATTVALADAEGVLAERTHIDPRHHVESLTPQIEQVLAESFVVPAALTHIVVGVGPGAFTGLRVGLASARALGDALDIPVHGLITLDAVAEDTMRSGPFGVVMDARRREVFWARYDNSRSRVAGPFVSPPAEALDSLSGLDLFGDATDQVTAPQFPTAAAMARVALARLRAGESLVEAEPVYLRRPDVSTPGTTTSRPPASGSRT